jgi:hypothetical protein
MEVWLECDFEIGVLDPLTKALAFVTSNFCCQKEVLNKN